MRPPRSTCTSASGRSREDGFHPLADRLPGGRALRRRHRDARDGLAGRARGRGRTSTPTGVPLDGDNIVDRAAALLAAHHGVDATGRPARSPRTIPVAGGMAGGSADAAAALVALDRLWDARHLRRRPARARRRARQRRAVRAGRRHRARHRPRRGRRPRSPTTAPGGGSSCRRRRRPVDARGLPPLRRAVPRRRRPTPPDAEALLAALRPGDPHRLAATLHNDLQAPALDLRPDLGACIDRGESEGALRGLVSGSGPTCVFLCESGRPRPAVAGALLADGEHPVVLVANGPVAGAHVVTHG